MPKQSYVSQGYFDDKFNEVNNLVRELHKKFDNLFEKIDWFAGKYTKLEEEQKLLSGRVSEHTDSLEKINQKLGINL